MTTFNYIMIVFLAFMVGYTLCMATEVKKWVDKTMSLGKEAMKCIDHMETIIARLCEEDVTQEEKDKAKRMAVRSQNLRLLTDEKLKKI